MENKIKIKIYGPQGSGKTRMVEFLTGVMLREGYVFYHNPYKKVTPIKGTQEEDFKHLIKVDGPLEVLMCSTNAPEGEVYRAEADRLGKELREKTKEVENLKDLVAAMRMEIADMGAELSRKSEQVKILRESEVWGKKVRGDIAVALNQKDEKRGNPKAKKYRLKHSAEGYFPPYHGGTVYPIDWDPQQDGVAPARLLIARYPEDWEPIKSEI